MKKYLTIFTLLFSTLLFVGTTHAQSGKKTEKSKSEQQAKDRPLKIIKSSPIGINVFNQCLANVRNRELFVRLRVTFHGSGKITDVEIAEDSGCEDFNNEAIKAAKSIKFLPVIKDGEPLTVTKSVDYRVGVR